MLRTARLTFRDGLRAQYLQFKARLLLSGLTETGEMAEVSIPIRAMSAVVDAIEAASGEGHIRAEDLPAVHGVLHVGEVRIGLVPRAGLAMRLFLTDGRETVVMFASRENEAVLRQAAEQITQGLALAVRGALPQ